MALVNIKIDGQAYQVEEGLTILEAAKKCGFNIPSLCAFHDGKCSRASCRVCLVEVKGARGLVASCVYPVNEGMEIIISSMTKSLSFFANLIKGVTLLSSSISYSSASSLNLPSAL